MAIQSLSILLILVHLICIVVSSPIAKRDAATDLPNKEQLMLNGLFAVKTYLKRTAVGDKKFKPILAKYNELIDLVSTMNKLNSAVSARSGDNTASYEHLLATQSILSMALKDACEWMKSELNVDQSLNCSNHDDIQSMVINVVTKAEIENAADLVEQLDASNDDHVSKYCEWVFCKMNPQCGHQSTTESTYLHLKKLINCSYTLNEMTCDQCSSIY